MSATEGVDPIRLPAMGAEEDDNNDALGIGFIVSGIFLYTLQDVLMKHLSAEYAVTLVVLLRCLVSGLVLFGLVVMRSGMNGFTVKRPWMIYLRGTLMFASYICYFLALAALPIAITLALVFTTPIIVTALSAPLLGEPVGGRRWAAVGAGFVGVILITEPYDATLDPAMLLALAAAVFYAGSIIMARILKASADGAAMGFHSNLCFLGWALLIGIHVWDGDLMPADAGPSVAFMLRAWRMPEFWDLMMIWACGGLAGFGLFLITEAYRQGSPSVVAPFEYVSMPLGALWGYLFFDTLPGLSAAMGMTIIIASGLYIARRERIRGRKPNAGAQIRPRT